MFVPFKLADSHNNIALYYVPVHGTNLYRVYKVQDNFDYHYILESSDNITIICKPLFYVEWRNMNFISNFSLYMYCFDKPAFYHLKLFGIQFSPVLTCASSSQFELMAI